MRVIHQGEAAELLIDWTEWDQEYLIYVQALHGSLRLYVRIQFLRSGEIRKVLIRELEIPVPVSAEVQAVLA